MFQRLIKKISRRLSRGSIPYMVIGGQAVLLYGEPRLTKDIDITLGVGIEGLDRVMQVVTETGIDVLVENPGKFVEKTMVLPALDKKSGIRVDFIFSFSPYERQAIERAKEIVMGGAPIRFASLEDVVIHKVISGRPRDFEDIRSILLKNPDYDRGYIEKWLKTFETSLGEPYIEAFIKIEVEIK